MPRSLYRLRSLLLVGSLVSAPAVAGARAQSTAPARTVPDSISDFAALVRSLSDSGGFFDTDNLISNERGYQQVMGAMDRLRVRGGAYIGVGPDQNFTYIAQVRPRIAFLIDIRRDNMLQHLLFKALFARASNRAEYLALWTGRPWPANPGTLGTLGTRAIDARSIDALVAWIDSTSATVTSAQRAKETVREEVQRSGITLSVQDLATIARFHDEFITDGLSLRFTSAGRAPQPYYPTLRQLILEHDATGRMRGYLASDESFQFLKSMQRRNLIVPVTGDLSGPKSLARIGAYLASNSARVSTLYVSNVEDYLLRDGQFAAYTAAVRALPRDTNAVIIRSFFGGGGHPESTPEYYATQLLQRMDAFANDVSIGNVRRYRDLTLRNYLPSRAPAPPRTRRDAFGPGFAPGARVLLDGHNAYPEGGQWADRIERVLATGTPVAIEQDLYWRRPPGAANYTSVVAHDSDATDGAPTLDAYFFQRIRPIMERALVENRRETWPLITLNLDFKTDEPEHHRFIYALLGTYGRWLTTAPRTGTPDIAAPLTVGPLLVLNGSDTAQRTQFHDEIPVGGVLRTFGAIPPTAIPGADKVARARRAVTLPAEQMIVPGGRNYARWANFPWSVVEEGGQQKAAAWTAADSARLSALVRRAHEEQLWIRFYTLDGFTPAQDRGFTASYNFGSLDAARTRWRAVIDSGVDFMATDQYGEFAAILRPRPPDKNQN